MKAIYKSICAICVICGFLSCDDTLETKNFTDMSPTNFFKSQGDFDAAVTGIYLPLTTNWGYSDGGTGKWFNSLFNADINAYNPAGMVTTDIMRHYSSYIYDEFNVGPSSAGAINSTYNMMRFVARATDVINQISNADGSTEEVRARYVAEAKTLRAFYMYTLLDFFGPCNVKLNPETLMSNEIEPRPTNEVYVGYIESDLNDAIATESFPDKYNNDADNWGRMSKSIAYAIQMRLYMHEKQWQKAKDACQKLMSMGFSLLSDYEDVFKSAVNDELIWSVPSNTASDNFYVTEVLPSDFKRGYNHNGRPYIRGNDNLFSSGWQVYCMRWEFYDT
ncbi:MAG: RagB/SusD family nutrient uptake outer membrane protein, partial [Prevotella sp.]